MFITITRSGYDSHGEQHTSGLFLMLVLDKYQHGACSPDNVRAIVRYVAMHQFGPWMMGSARIGAHRLTLSGSYGADGLIMDVPSDVYDRAIPLPRELYEAWKHGGGWNGAGSESDAMRRWAKMNLKALYNVRRPSIRRAYRSYYGGI